MDIFIDVSEREFENMVGAISDIFARTEDAFSGLCTLEFPELCSALMQLIDPDEKDVQQGIMALKIFRKIIERENKKFSTPSANWQTEDYIGKIILHLYFNFVSI